MVKLNIWQFSGVFLAGAVFGFSVAMIVNIING